MFYLGVAGAIALVMVPAFAVPYAAKSWLMLVLIAGILASLCALSFVYYLPILTKPLEEAFFPGIFAVLGGFAGIGIGFGAVTRGVILFLRGRGEPIDEGRITSWGIGLMLIGTYSVLWIVT